MALPGDLDAFVFLENSRPPGFGDGKSLLFTEPTDIVACHSPAGVPPALNQIEAAAQRGLFPAGYISYEASYGFEEKLKALTPASFDVPLLWFGLFRHCEVLDATARARFWTDRKERRFAVGNVAPNISEADYLKAFERVHEYLRCGDAYQINLTFKLNFQVSGDTFALMYALVRNQPVEYGAFINTPERKVLSLSPELFLRKCGDTLTSKPMKGTWSRGLDQKDDADQMRRFADDEKSRAENLMIVDLIRNDLSRISSPGTVDVSARFAIETYRTLSQITSTVDAQVLPDTSFENAIRALFPCGSITGAPKIRCMEIIRDLEKSPRGTYTGAVGFVCKGSDGAGVDYCFNVPIRTLVLDNDGRGEMGVGSGIVAESVAQSEYQECLLKARFLTDPQPPLQLIETMLWQPQTGIWLLERHLERLDASAQYFQIPINVNEIRSLIDLHVTTFAGTVKRRVRLLFDESGHMSMTSAPVLEPAGSQTVRISKNHTRSDDLFLRHKTTHRALYTSELLAARVEGHLEVLFLNERGEMTEGAVTNLFVEKDGVLLTPPISCGLLPGTFRKELIAKSNPPIEERVLLPGDLATADKIYVGNSVMGLIEVHLKT